METFPPMIASEEVGGHCTKPDGQDLPVGSTNSCFKEAT